MEVNDSHNIGLESLDVRAGPGLGVAQVAPDAEADRRQLARWAAGVGPVLTRVPKSRQQDSPLERQKARPPEAPTPDTGCTVVSWNARVGGGEIYAFWEYVLHVAPPGPVVLLLQEVYSTGSHIPSSLPDGAVGALAIADQPRRGPRTDIGSFATEADLFLFYAPSMRNGAGPEDRGNAVLANVPLNGLTAIDLPFERQRRVAVAADVELGNTPFRVCSAHLDNRAPWGRAWRSLGSSRTRQMAGLLKSFPRNPPSALGGDFNTWVRGTRERAYELARMRFPHPYAVDPRPTHHFELGGFLRRSDHLLFDLPTGWRGRVERMDETFGSDHHPLVGVINRGASREELWGRSVR